MPSPRSTISFLCTLLAAGLACGPPSPADTGLGTTGLDSGTASTTTPTTGVTSGEVSTTSGVSSTGEDTLIISAGDDDSCGFICATGEPSCASIPGLDDRLEPRCYPCDLYTQNCHEGEKCVATAEGGAPAWNMETCVPVNGDRRPGEGCTVLGDGMDGLDDCIKGAMCWGVNADKVGTCVALCGGSFSDPLCPDPATACALFNDSVLNLCLPVCDPRVDDCADAEVCQPYNDRFVCGPDNSGAEGQVNDFCYDPGACDPGLVCAPSSASPACDPRLSGCCQPYCAYPDGVCADPAQTCAQWFNPMDLPANDPGLGVGVCSIAP